MFDLKLQSFFEFWREQKFIQSQNSQNSKISGDLLLIPRRLVQVKKEKASTLIWYIQNGMSQKASQLKLPTSLTNVALRSGLRGCIIKNDDGSYTKLKGVFPRLRYDFKRKSENGLLTKTSAVRDFSFSFGHYVALKRNNMSVFSKPIFLETDLDKNLSYQQQLDLLLSKAVGVHIPPLNDIGDYSSIEKIILAYNSNEITENLPVVIGFQVQADTRLDEFLYHTTHRNQEIALSASFIGGIGFGKFLESDLSLGINDHIGNIVLGEKNGFIYSQMVDFDTAYYEQIQGTNGDHLLPTSQSTLHFFRERIQKALPYLLGSFHTQTTYSGAKRLKYKSFTPKLKERCTNAFKTGLYTYIYDSYGQIFANSCMSLQKKKALFPKIFPLSKSHIDEALANTK